MKAIEATDNILSLEQNQKDSDQESSEETKQTPSVRKLKSFSRKGNEPLAHDKIANLISMLESCDNKVGIHRSDNIESMQEPSLRQDNRGMCSEQIIGKSRDNSSDKVKAKQIVPQQLSDTVRPSQIHDNNGIKQKLKSGKCALPDEVNIKRVVKFPHKKLDSRHVQEKVFDKLPFNLLIAGELETISLEKLDDEERRARVQLSKTMCYHKNYLNDDELCNGYDNVIKQVEQGTEDWTDALANKLHEYYVFRANVNLRNKMEEDSFTKVERKSPE